MCPLLSVPVSKARVAITGISDDPRGLSASSSPVSGVSAVKNFGSGNDGESLTTDPTTRVKLPNARHIIQSLNGIRITLKVYPPKNIIKICAETLKTRMAKKVGLFSIFRKTLRSTIRPSNTSTNDA